MNKKHKEEVKMYKEEIEKLQAESQLTGEQK